MLLIVHVSISNPWETAVSHLVRVLVAAHLLDGRVDLVLLQRHGILKGRPRTGHLGCDVALNIVEFNR